MNKTMNILVIGANGGIGRKVVEVALTAGHNVTALLRTPGKLTISHERLSVVQGDILELHSFASALVGMDAVVSAIGEHMDRPTTLYSAGNRNLLRAIQQMNVGRAFFISASAIEVSPKQPFYIRLATKYIVQKLFGHGYADQRIMEKLIKESSINWTIMRPPRLIDKPATRHYRVAINEFLKNSLKISRADVADYIVNNINNQATYKAVIEIAY